MHRLYSKDQNAETHEIMKLANRNCNKIIAQAKRDHWIAFSDSVSAGKVDLGSAWKTRKMKQQYVAPDSNLQEGSRVYTTDRAKADAFSWKPLLKPVTLTASLRTCDSSDGRWRLLSRTRCWMTVWRLTLTPPHPNLHRAKTSFG